jgi:hypothetical protein
MNVLNLVKSLKLSTYVTLDLGSIKKFITNQIKKLAKANKKTIKKKRSNLIGKKQKEMKL